MFPGGAGGCARLPVCLSADPPLTALLSFVMFRRLCRDLLSRRIAKCCMHTHTPLGPPQLPQTKQVEAIANMGQEGAQRAHQAHHGSRHSVVRPRDRGHKRVDHVHHVPRRRRQDSGDQAPLPGDDPQEPQEVLYVRGAGAGRQKRPQEIPRLQLPEHDARQAVYLHDAHAVGRGKKKNKT